MKKTKILKLTILILILAICQIVPSQAVEEYTIENGTIKKYKGDVSELVIPEIINGQTVTAIEEFAFYFNSKLTKVTIPGTVEHIKSGAFCHCNNLSEIIVSSGTIGIGSGAFRSLPALTQIELPDTITYLEEDAFLESSTNFTVIAPQYKLNGSTIEETEVAKLAKSLQQTNSISYSPTNYAVFITQPQNGTIKVSNQVVKTGDTITVTVTPNQRYEVEKVTYKEANGTETELTGNEITMSNQNITIAATLRHKTHQITSSAGENGTITPLGTTTILEGNNQTYQITPNEGYKIATIKIDGEEISKTTSYTFTKVEEDHEITVTFKELICYILTTNISNIIETTIEKDKGQEITIKTGSTTNFISWTTTGIEDQSDRSFTFSMPNNHTTITYNYNEPDYTPAIIETTPTVSGETATVTLDETELSNKIATTETDTLEIEVGKVSNETEVEVTIKVANIEEITEKENISQLKITTEIGTLYIQEDALETIKNKATGAEIAVTIKECDENDLTAAQKEKVGDSPVYKLEIKSGSTTISQFNGNIIVTVPYTPESGENTNRITVYYIAEDGSIESMPTIYKNQQVSFTTNHFSQYYIEEMEENESIPQRPEIDDSEMEEPDLEEPEIDNPQEEDKEDEKEDVSQKPDTGDPEINNPQEEDKEDEKEDIPQNPDTEEPEIDNPQEEDKDDKKQPPRKYKETTEKVVEQGENKNETEEIELNYVDVKENAWYIEAIKYAVKNNIASGTTEETFSPGEPITRGQAITMLCKSYNIQEEFEGENFIDAGDTYYTGYIQALKNKKIIEGVGNNKVEPKREITRQELLVLVYKLVEFTSSKKEITQLEEQEIKYEDQNEIAAWAKEAVEYFVKTKTIVGDNGKINPRRNITRAETVQIIYNLNK